MNGELWDLDRPFEKDAELKLIKFDDDDGEDDLYSDKRKSLRQDFENV